MRIYYFDIRVAGPNGNFGDHANTWLWEKYLNPKIGKVWEGGNFYGIGTVLGEPMPKASKHLVFGAGLGYRGVPTPDETWDIRFVRGYRTAKALGGAKYLTDPLALAMDGWEKQEVEWSYSFMPAWDCVHDVAELERHGYHVISPAWPHEKIMDDISRTGVLLTSALHGAVVANAIRVPFISIYAETGHEFKWHDWCSGLEMVWNPIDMREFTMDWAKRNAIPQLSSANLLRQRVDGIRTEIDRLNEEIECA